MKRLRNITKKIMLILFTIYLIVFSVIPENNFVYGYNKSEVQQAVVEYAREWKDITVYVWGGTSLTNGADCSGFVGQIYKGYGYNLPRTAAEISKAGAQVSLNELELGDIIVVHHKNKKDGRDGGWHCGIYSGNGKYVHSPHTGAYVTESDIPSAGSQKLMTARRIITDTNWNGTIPTLHPNGVASNGSVPGNSVSGGATLNGFKGKIDDETVSLDDLEFRFAGNPQKMEYNGEEKLNPWIFSKLSQLIDYILGIIASVSRVSIVGWAAIIEAFINSMIHSLSGTVNDKIYTVEDVIFNRIPIFDANVFSSTAGGEKVTEDSPAGVIRDVVANWYVAVRNIVAVFLMIMFIYTAIRMAIATVAQDKANYKQYLIGWLKSVILLFVINYILMLILNLNGILVGMFSGDSSQENLIYETIRTRAYDIRFSVGVTGAIMYIALIFMFVRFIWVYGKRFFTVIILTIMSPIIVGKYSFESASGKKSVAFSKFMYLYGSNVLIQSAHALIYTSLVSIAMNIALESITGFILALVFMSFMLKADQIVLKLFKFDTDIGDIRAPFKKKEELAGIYYSYGIYKLTKNRVKDGVRTVKHIGASGVKAVGNKFGKEDIISDVNEAINKEKTKVDRKLLAISDKYLGKESETSQNLILKIASRRKGTSGRLAKQALKLRKVERKQRYTSNYKYILSEVKGVGSIILAVPTMVFSPSVGIGLASRGINTIKKNGKQEKLRHWTTKQKVANAVTLGHYGNRLEAKEKISKNKKELDALVFSIMKSNKSMDNVEIELERYTDPEDRKKAKEVMKQVVNMKADVGKIKSSIENYLIRNSISSIDDMSKSELRNMVSNVTTSICRDSNLSEDVIKDAINEILIVSNISVQGINENQGEEALQHIHTAQNINSPQNENTPQGNNTEPNTNRLQNNRRENRSQNDNREQNKNEFTVRDINRFAQVINESMVKTVAGNKFLNIAQEINKMKEAEISTKAAAEDATGDDDTELININRYIDNL